MTEPIDKLDAEQLAQEARLKRLIQWAATLGLSAMTGFILSIRSVNPSIQFKFDWITFLGLVVGGWMGWIFWRLIPREGSGNARSGRRRWIPLMLWFAVLTGIMVGGFAYGMKDINNARQREMFMGTGMALLVLSFVGFLLWRIGKFLEDDHRKYLDEHPQEKQK